jgi:cyclase
MLAKRVIPTLLTKGNQLVKGAGFDSWRAIGVAMQAAKVHAMRSVDELIVLDITATPQNRGPNLSMVEGLTKDCYIPVTIGGGVRSIGDVRDLLNAGADKVAICTAIFDDPMMVRKAADKFGSQAIVVSIDVIDKVVAMRCGTVKTKVDPVTWARGAETMGAGEIMLTSIDCDGIMEGYDLELIRSVTQSVSIPVIASGGAGTYQHMLEAIQAGADAVAAGAMFAFTEQTPRGACEYLRSKGVEVRL